MSTQTTIPDPHVTPTLKVEATARILDMSLASTYAAIDRGEIPVLRFGRRIVVPTAKLLAMLGIDHAR